MSMQMPDFSVEELQRIIVRNSFAMNLLTERVGTLTRENAELLAIIQELQNDLAQAREILQDLKNTEDLLNPPPEVGSNHAVVQSMAAEQPVPSG